MQLENVTNCNSFIENYRWRLTHITDLKKQIHAYRDSISSGHGVLVVAHSQGNLFTREAYDALDPCMQKQFEAVSIASPMHADIKEETSFNLNNISA